MVKEICGVGIDCENVSRFKKLNNFFFNKNFTQKEREYCASKPDSFRHFAARFACKEAIIKAAYSAGEKLFFNDIEILNDKNGIPKAKVKKQQFSKFDVKISISHSEDMAIALAVLMK